MLHINTNSGTESVQVNYLPASIPNKFPGQNIMFSVMYFILNKQVDRVQIQTSSEQVDICQMFEKFVV